jgi:hypothetical protein
MKIALCFSGQPRFIEQVSPLIKQNIIGDYDVDVFAHLWFDEDLQTKPYKYGGSGGWVDQRIASNAIEQFEETYKPKKLVVEKSKKFLDSTLSDNYMPSLDRYKGGKPDYSREPNFEVRDVNNIISYHYSLLQACLLKKEYEYANDFKYDYVVRMRTDSMVHNKIQYESFPKDIVFFSGMQNQPDGMINDWFNFGGSKVMDPFMSAFPVVEYCIDECMKQTGGAWCCELIHRKVIDFFNIPCHPLPINITLPRF